MQHSTCCLMKPRGTHQIESRSVTPQNEPPPLSEPETAPRELGCGRQGRGPGASSRSPKHHQINVQPPTSQGLRHPSGRFFPPPPPPGTTDPRPQQKTCPENPVSTLQDNLPVPYKTGKGLYWSATVARTSSSARG